jgi:serine/threonine protein kinase
MYCLLDTLDSVHARGVMHRDVKPGNVCISHKRRHLCLIDWGLADLYYPRTQYTTRVSTLRYKAPELLLGYHFYDYGIDIWGAGCIMAQMLFSPKFIPGETVEEVTASVAGLWGNRVIYQYCEKYGIDIPEILREPIARSVESSWGAAVLGLRPDMVDEDALDLVKALLTVDHGGSESRPVKQLSSGSLIGIFPVNEDQYCFTIRSQDFNCHGIRSPQKKKKKYNQLKSAQIGKNDKLLPISREISDFGKIGHKLQLYTKQPELLNLLTDSFKQKITIRINT